MFIYIRLSIFKVYPLSLRPTTASRSETKTDLRTEKLTYCLIFFIVIDVLPNVSFF